MRDQLEELLRRPHDPRNQLVTGSALAAAAVGLATGLEVPAALQPVMELAAAGAGVALDHARRRGNSSPEEDDGLLGPGLLYGAAQRRGNLDI